MLNKNIILKFIEGREIFSSKIFNQVWLIGSFAKDKSHEKSDIDFLIEYNESEMSSSNLDAWANSINSLERHFNREVQFIPSDRFPEMDLDKEAIKIK